MKNNNVYAQQERELPCRSLSCAGFFQTKSPPDLTIQRVLLAERWGFEPQNAFDTLHDFQSCALDQLSHLSTWKPEAVVSGLSDTVKNRITVQRHSDAVNVSARPTGRALLPPQIFGSYYEEAHSFPDREAAAAHAPSPAVPSTRNRKRPEE